MWVGQVKQGTESDEDQTLERVGGAAWRGHRRDHGDRALEEKFAQQVAVFATALSSLPTENRGNALDEALETLITGLGADSAAFYAPASQAGARAPAAKPETPEDGSSQTRFTRVHCPAGRDSGRVDAEGVSPLPDQLDLERLPDQGQALLAGQAQRTFVPDSLLSFAEARVSAQGAAAAAGWRALSPSAQPQPRTHTLLLIPCPGPKGVLGLFVVRGGAAAQRGSTSVLSSAGLLGALMGSFLERVRLESELRLRRDEADHADRLATLGQVASSVAHDFNNVLTAIVGNAELLDMILPEDAKGRAEAQEISEAAERAAGLVEEMLCFARKKESGAQRIQLAERVGGLRRMIQRVAGNALEVVIDLPADLPCVEVNPGRLERLLLNLASNARDAQPANRTRCGRFSLSGQLVEIDAAAHSTLPDGRYVCLLAEDDGCGMDASVCAQVFEPFFTTKAEGRGTGLGLATCAEVMREAGGDVIVDSAPGEGAAFQLYFPVAAEE